jgi:hypothetical protein
MSQSEASWSESPFVRALWPYAVVGGAISLVLHFLVEPFVPSIHDTWTKLYPMQALIVAAGLVVILRCCLHPCTVLQSASLLCGPSVAASTPTAHIKLTCLFPEREYNLLVALNAMWREYFCCTDHIHPNISFPLAYPCKGKHGPGRRHASE